MMRFFLGVSMAAVASTGGAMDADIQHWTTDNGTKVLFVERHELPIVDVRLAFDAGSARDGAQPGLARMVSNLLLDGTAEQDAGDIARRFERFGARVSAGSGRDMAEISLRSLSDPSNLEPVIEQLSAVIAGANFPEDAVARVRQQMVLGLQQAESSASSLAEKAFAAAVYGEHPYASPPQGTLESVPEITRADLQAFHASHYVAGNATLAIVGNLTQADAAMIANQLTAGLPAGEAAAPLPGVELPTASQVVRVPFEAGQTHVVIGQPSVARGDEAYYPLYFGNHLLGGGGLTSLLAERMREERGLSYSSYSRLSTGAERGRFEMGTQVRNEALDEALEVLRGTLVELIEQGPEADRLEDSRRNITGSFPLQLDSNRSLLGHVTSIGFHELPHDYLSQFVARIEDLDGARVQEAMRAHLDPQRMITVLVGPAEVIEAVAD